MARGFSYSGAGTVYTPYFAGISRGYITINSVSFNESTGKITINWDAGFNCIYDNDKNNSGGNCSAIAACFGGSVYDDALYLDNGGTYYSNYMAHPRGTVEGATGACLLYAASWDGTKVILNDHDHVINATSSLSYGVKTQMNYGWGWLNRWDGRQSDSVFQNINGGTLYFTLPQYDIKYNANGGSSTPTTQTKNYNANVTVAGGISRLGYKFTGWKASNDTVYQGGATYSTNASTTLTAQWEAEQYSITYNANGGSGAPNKQTYTYDASASINLSSTEPTRTGYTFKGWSTSSTATSASYSAGQTWGRNNMGNYTLYAVWEINQYYIALNGRLDGSDASNLGVYGSADITVNGTKVLQGGTDYYSKHNYGSTYSITNIKANSGYQYDGVQTGQTSGTIGTSDVSVRLKFSTTKPSQVQANGSWTSPFDIELSWSAVGLNINYTIYYKKDSENNYTTINCGSQLRANIAVEEETTYNIYILATNAGGSTSSNSLTITTPADQAKVYIKAGDGATNHPAIDGYQPVGGITASSADQMIVLKDEYHFTDTTAEITMKWNDINTVQNIGSNCGGYFGVANGYYTFMGEQTQKQAKVGEVVTVRLVSTFSHADSPGLQGGSTYYDVSFYINNEWIAGGEGRSTSAVPMYFYFYLFGCYNLSGSTATIYQAKYFDKTYLPYRNIATQELVFINEDKEIASFNKGTGIEVPNTSTWQKGKLFFKLNDQWKKVKKIYIKKPDVGWVIGVNEEKD